MHWHIIEGDDGCQFAVERRCVAVIVDALRASATAAMLLHHGAREILVVKEVSGALAAKQDWPDALLFGERGGLPPSGFDYGNSPRDAQVAAGRRVIFTTTNGAQCLVGAWGAKALYMGTTVNASAVARAAAAHGADVVLIPAGLSEDPGASAPEDWAAAAWIVQCAGGSVGEGRAAFNSIVTRIESEGMQRIFATAPHAANLRTVGLAADVSWCAQCDVTELVPTAVSRCENGVILRR